MILFSKRAETISAEEGRKEVGWLGRMGSCGRSSLSFFIASRPFHLRHQSSDRLLPSLGLTHLNLKRKLSLSITSFSSKILSPPPLSDKDKRSNALPRGAGEGVKEDARSKLLQVVLVSPQVTLNH